MNLLLVLLSFSLFNHFEKETSNFSLHRVGQFGNRSQVETFNEFWPAFRNAVLLEDKASITRMISFPFGINGIDSNGDVLKGVFEKDKYYRIFQQCLKQNATWTDENGKEVKISQLELIKRTSKVKVEKFSGNYVTVGNFHFNWTDGKWKLTSAKWRFD